MATSNIKNWSITPANNNSAPPFGAPEGMSPSAVNDIQRENMAAVRLLAENGEWFDFGDTAVFVSTTSFKIVASNQTANYTVGRRIRVVASTPGTIYGTITASVFSTDTTVTIDFDSTELTNETLDSTELGIISPTNKSSVIQSEELFAVDTGAADAYEIDIVPAPSAYVTGQMFTFKAINANTGATTINVNGLGAKGIIKNITTALESGDIVANQIISIIYDGTNFKMVGAVSLNGLGDVALTSLITNEVLTWTGTKWVNQTAAEIGKLIDVQVFTASGTWTKPAGATAVKVTVTAGGGGGGGAASGDRGGSGGGAGGTAKEHITSGLSATETITIGAAGTAGASGASTGGNGGTSSFGAFCSATGGTGGVSGTTPVGGVGGVGSGGDINIDGGQGNAGSTTGGAIIVGQSGGGSIWGSGGASPNAGNDGLDGKAFGAGGGGGSSEGSSEAGGAGKIGVIVVESYT